MAEPKPDNISAPEWDAISGLVYRYYVDEKRTLKETMNILKVDHGFPSRGRASERMFKTRIQKWGMDLKTIRHDEWELMWQIYHNRQIHFNKQTRFQVVVAGESKEITFAQIKKHYKRVDPQKQSAMDDQKSNELRQRLRLRYETPPGSPEIPPTALPGPRRVSGEQGDSDLHISRFPHFRDERAPIYEDNTPDVGLEFPGSHCGPGFYNRRKIPQWEGHAIDLPHIQLDANFGQSSFQLPPILCPSMDDPSLTSPPPGGSNVPSLSSSPGDIMENLSELFSKRMSLDSACDELTKQRFRLYIGCQATEESPATSDGVVEQSEYLAAQWGYHCMLSCILRDDNPTLATWHRQSAKTMFEAILVRAPRFILPGLNWFTSNFGAISRTSYRMFLDECIEIIDRVQKPNVMYGLLYKYARAVFEKQEAAARNDQASVDRYQAETDSLGASFERSEAQIRQIFGPESRNMLVFNFYYVWHLLEKRQFEKAFDKMKVLRKQSESIAGPDDFLTINCLAMTSRAYDQINDRRQALYFIQTAVERSRVKLDDKNPFRLKLIHHLALIYKKDGRLDETERLMTEVFEGRLEVLGSNSNFTWGSMEDLRTFLIERGRLAEASSLKDRMTETFRREDLARKIRTLGVFTGDTWAAFKELYHFYESRGRIAEATRLHLEMGDLQRSANQRSPSHEESPPADSSTN